MRMYKVSFDIEKCLKDTEAVRHSAPYNALHKSICIILYCTIHVQSQLLLIRLALERSRQDYGLLSKRVEVCQLAASPSDEGFFAQQLETTQGRPVWFFDRLERRSQLWQTRSHSQQGEILVRRL